MPVSEWGLEFPEEDDFTSDPSDSPLDDPTGEPCIERHCRECGQAFMMNLYLAERMGDESPLCKCQKCLGAQIRLGGKRVRARDANDASQPGRDQSDGVE